MIAALAPLFTTDFFLNVILTKTLWLGVAAASLIFLAAYGGMVSLAQVGLYGVAGMTYANLVLADGGSAAAWNPWLAVIAALVVATLVGLGFGWIAARSEGIYFLMITLAFSVLVFYFFSQVTQLSGFGGVNSVDLPGILGNPEQDPAPRYFVTLVVGRGGVRVAARARDAHGVRARAPGHPRRAGAHARARLRRDAAPPARVRPRRPSSRASPAILSVWYNSRITPGSINLEQTINILIIAVIGGLYRLEGAWIGALAYALIDNYSREWVPEVGNVLGPARFNTIIGLVFLIIVLISPGGLVGIWEDVRDRLGGRRRGGGTPTTTTTAGPGTGRHQALSTDGDERRGVLRGRKLLTLLAALAALALSSWAVATTTTSGGDEGGGHRGAGGGRHDQGRLPVRLRGRIRLVLRADHLRRASGADPLRRRHGRGREAERRHRGRADRRQGRRDRRLWLRRRHGRQGDRGDAPPDGAGGRRRHDRPALR